MKVALVNHLLKSDKFVDILIDLISGYVPLFIHLCYRHTVM